MKEKFKQIFDPYTNSTRYYVQHIDYKNLTIPKDVFDDMSDDEVTNYVSNHLNEINNQLNDKQKKPTPQNVLSDKEISDEFEKIKKYLNGDESFKSYFHRKVN
jgi:hypothetical protein